MCKKPYHKQPPSPALKFLPMGMGWCLVNLPKMIAAQYPPNIGPQPIVNVLFYVRK